MGEVTTFKANAGLVSRDELVRGLNNIATAAPAVGGEYQFLKMDKGNGEWLYGQEETVVEDGSLWAVNPLSLQYGYIAWNDDNKVEGEVMVPITRPLPDKGSLRCNTPDGQPTGSRGWQYQQSVVLACVTGEDQGTQVLYKQSSVGSQKLFNTLVNAIQAQVEKGKGEIVPIIEMKSDSYKHDKYGRIYNPVFEIKEWRTLDDSSAPAAAAEGPSQADEEAELAAEYAELQKSAPAAAAAAPAADAPRRRVRR